MGGAEGCELKLQPPELSSIGPWELTATQLAGTPNDRKATRLEPRLRQVSSSARIPADQQLVKHLRRQYVASAAQDLLWLLCPDLVAVVASDDFTHSARSIEPCIGADLLCAV